MMTEREIVARLVDLPAAEVDLALVRELTQQWFGGNLTVDGVLGQMERIESALAKMERLSQESHKLALRLLNLPPSPGRRVPIGF